MTTTTQLTASVMNREMMMANSSTTSSTVPDSGMDAAVTAALTDFWWAAVAAYERLGQPHAQAKESADLVTRELVRRTVAVVRGEATALDLEGLLALPLSGTPARG